MEKKYFLIINSYNLAHYFGSAIIAPSIYYENRNPDLQNRFDNYLLLCNSKFVGDSNCALEIIFNEKEELPKKITENFYLFDMPLPISRVKGVYFLDEKQKVTTEFNVTSGSAFIPKDLLHVSDEGRINAIELDSVELKQNPVDWSAFIRRFDQLMGGFSLMNIVRDKDHNYSPGYFSALGHVNRYFAKILASQNIEVKANFLFAFTDEGKFREFHDTIYSELDFNILKRYAEKDKVPLESRNGLVLINKIPENTQTYLLAVLDSYGTNRRKSIDSFVSDLLSGTFSRERSEGLALIFGINKGYKSFRNRYKTNSFEVSIKFKLDSQLDYYTIESVYQNVFNDLSEVSSFSYIDSWCPKKNLKGRSLSGYKTFRVLDELVIVKKNEDFLEQLLQSLHERKHRIFSTLVERIVGFFPGFFNVDRTALYSMLSSDLDLTLREYAEFVYKSTSEAFAEDTQRVEDLEKYIESQNALIDNLRSEVSRISDDLRAEKAHKLVQGASTNELSAETVERHSDTGPNVLIGNPSHEDLKLDKKRRQSSKSRGPAKGEKTLPLPFDGALKSRENARLKELEALSSKALKDVASKLNIPLVSKDTKENIITMILKTEFE